MKCKECKERIPDNVKYCPECGALANENGGSLRGVQTNGDDEKIPAFPQIPFTGSQRKINLPHMSLLSLIIIVFIIFFAGFFAVSVFVNMADWSTPVEVYVEEDLNMVESVAYDYASNIIDCESFQSVDTFRSQTLIEWELVCRDFYRENFYESSLDESVCYEYAEDCMHNAFDLINSRYSIGFEPFNFYFECQGTRSLDNIESEYYFDLISSSLSSMDTDAEDYYDRDQIGNLYEVQYYVSTADENSYVWDDFGTINVIVAEIYGQYFVLYDDAYISTLLDSII